MADSFFHMQSAVDIVGASLHATNKIAATLTGQDADGREFSLSCNNYWPQPIKDKIGIKTEVGNSSGTVHAETACLLHAPRTDGASLFVTDPPCPNCVKNMAEAGVKALYIDHKGFDKDFAARRGEDYRTLSLHICEHAGISVYKVFRKERKLENLLQIAPGYKPLIEKPARTEPLQEPPSSQYFLKLIEMERRFYKDRPFAVAIAQGPSGPAMISAEVHAIAGFTSKMAKKEEGKYNLLLQPVHRVLMTAARQGLKIDADYLFSSRVPTARELVNLTGAGLTKLHLSDHEHARDAFGLQALGQLRDAGILDVRRI